MKPTRRGPQLPETVPPAVSPLAALVELCRALPLARSMEAERELIRSVGAVRELVEAQTAAVVRKQEGQGQEADGELSPLARKMLTTLSDQKLHVTTWAMATRPGKQLSADSGTFQRAKRELLAAGLVKACGKGRYKKVVQPADVPAPDAPTQPVAHQVA